MARISVSVPHSPAYDILIERGLLNDLSERAVEFGLDGSVVIITNDTLLDLYGEILGRQLPQAEVALMGDGEHYKNLDTVRDLYDQLLAFGADRHTLVFAFGGGVVGDTAGFVAASYMRGVTLVQMPTSLLAMVDSSVGGKVGVDLPQGKNLVGAFKQPERVLIDPDVLGTLPAEHWRCGMGEVLKHGLLSDATLLQPELHDPDHAHKLVERAVQVKVNVVQEDPYEQGVRAHLNLGHTFAHAIEQVTQYRWLHGDAVGFGLLAAATLSQKMGLIDAALVEQIDTLLAETGLPRTINLAPEALYEAMKTDKKWKSGVSHFVLLEGLNQPTIRKGIERELVIEVLQALQD